MHTARHCEVETESDVAWHGGMRFTACLTLSFWVFFVVFFFLLGFFFSYETGSTELRAIVTHPGVINIVIPSYGRIGVKV